jgi:AraC-like DNA-binding protein
MQWRGRISLAAGAILYVGPGATADAHAHHAVQLVWSADPFVLHVAGRRLERRAVLVPSSVRHLLDATGAEIALLLVEAHGPRGAALDAVARLARYRDLSQQLAARPLLSSSGEIGLILEKLGILPMRSPITFITRRAIEYIEEHLAGVPRVTDLASLLGVSPTRITHLFTAEVGIPFRRFVLWTRIKRATVAYRRGRDLTAAALEAGFCDAAHFSRVFRAMFGLSPSLALPASRRGA